MINALKQGDTFPPLRAEVTDSEGNPIALTDASVLFVMAPSTGGAPIVSAPAQVTGENEVTYQWAEGDTDVAGKFYGEFVVTLPSGRILTAPNGESIRLHILRGVNDG